MKLLFDRKNVLVHQQTQWVKFSSGKGYLVLLRGFMPLKDCSILNSSFAVTLNPLGSENALIL